MSKTIVVGSCAVDDPSRAVYPVDGRGYRSRSAMCNRGWRGRQRSHLIKGGGLERWKSSRNLRAGEKHRSSCDMVHEYVVYIGYVNRHTFLEYDPKAGGVEK